MTNVNGTPRKRATRKGLFQYALETLEGQGWAVTRVPRGGKASLRQITKGAQTHKISIRTSQDAWIAFPRRSDGNGWVTLDDVDFVIAASVNDRVNPTEARIHMIPGDDARQRFNRAYAARQAAGHTLPAGRGIWLSLYDQDAGTPVSHVGAGMGLAFRPIATLDLRTASLPTDGDDDGDELEEGREEQAAPAPTESQPVADVPLTISEAKRRLALSLGVPELAIKISVEH